MVWAANARNDSIVGLGQIVFNEAFAETYEPDLAIVSDSSRGSSGKDTSVSSSD